MTHRQAVGLMVLATLMWSIAGVVSRQLEAARSFEVTFWRSAFNALGLLVLLSFMRGPGTLMQTLSTGGRALWLSGLCWAVMFTNFMVALTLTSVANVLVTMALGPLFTALLSRAVLKHRLQTRTWVAIGVAGVGIAWMYGQEVSAGDSKQLLGMLVALGVPIASAVNWTLLQHLKNQNSASTDMLPAVLVGALLSAAATLPLSMPFAASAADVGWLALLGVVQLAIPCLIAVAVARVLSGPEIALLALLEVLFGVAWAWMGANESPSSAVLGGGLLVLAALAGNEWLGMRAKAAGR
jgi:drug/metabolite transporter (DMT)-like permease